MSEEKQNEIQLMDVVLDIPEPHGDQDVHDTWVLWAVLEYLKQAGKARRPYVPASELREFVLQYMPQPYKRDYILTTLRNSRAIAVLNKDGQHSKRYFLVKGVGQSALKAYRKYLLDKGLKG
jgi:hypothetical protein